MTTDERNRIRALAEKLKTSDPTTGNLEGVMAVGALVLLDELDRISSMVFALVIERSDSEPSKPVYFTGKRHAALRWSDPGDHAEACRFARKQDAERVAELAGFYPPNPTHRICEHGWSE